MLIRHEHDLAQLAGLVRAHGLPCSVMIGDEPRTNDQNSKLWPMLADISSQCRLMIDGKMEWASKEDWKNIFIAALKSESRMARGIDGQIVYLQASSRNLTKREFSDLIELIYAYGSNNWVKWSDPALKAYAQYREAQ